MKIRNGFVSNSSSSSFIVNFPYKPTSIYDVKDMLFNGRDYAITGYGDECMTTSEISEQVFRDLRVIEDIDIDLIDSISIDYYGNEWNIEVNADKALLEEYADKYNKLEFARKIYNELDRKSQYPHVGISIDYTRYDIPYHNEELDNLLNQISSQHIDHLKKDYDGYIQTFDYGDTIMEYGGIFDNVKHTVINNH